MFEVCKEKESPMNTVDALDDFALSRKLMCYPWRFRETIRFAKKICVFRSRYPRKLLVMMSFMRLIYLYSEGYDSAGICGAKT